jgi:uncharacterized protein YggE
MRFIPFLFVALLLAGCPSHHLVAQKSVSQLLVRGKATLKVKPDQVEMSLEAVTSAGTADEALAINSEAVVRLRELLEAEGLNREDYRTGQFSIQPQWSRPPRPAPANWAPEIVGYRVSNSLQVTTAKIDLAGRLLALANKVGVNKIGNLRFTLADQEAASRQAIAAATAKARQRAETLAQAAGVKLGRLLEARVADEGPGGQPMFMMAESRSLRAENDVPLSAGEVEVKAAVVLSYALAD